ncbi:MAG: hypothetical protein ACYDED_14980 [Ferrimicrobium sp.]
MREIHVCEGIGFANGDSVAATAQLNRQMPGFLSRLEEVLGSTQRTLVSIEARLANIEVRVNRPSHT